MLVGKARKALRLVNSGHFPDVSSDSPSLPVNRINILTAVNRCLLM